MVGRASTNSSAAIVAFRASCGNAVASVGDVTESSSGLERQTVSAVIMSRAARWNSDAFLLSLTPAEVWLADALAASIMIHWAIGRNVGAVVSERAPSSSGLEADAFSTAVRLVTTLGNNSARISLSAPSAARIADALAAIIVILSAL